MRIRDARGERLYRASDFPLIAGGPGAADVELPGVAPGERVALLGLAEGALYWQRSEDALPRWLAPGDVLAAGGARLRCELTPDGVLLRVDPALEGVTLPPDLDAEEVPVATPLAPVSDAIAATEFRATRVAPVRREPRSPWSYAGAAAVVAFGAIVWFLVTARAVTVDVEPVPDALSVGGGLGLTLGGHWLLRPGKYTVVASKEGYEPLSLPIEVTDADSQRFEAALVKLPGRLRVRASAPGTEILVDGAPRGTAPLDALEVPPGEHTLLARAPRYLPLEQKVAVEGGGVEQTLELKLAPAWAEVSVASEPAGAELRVDGENVGATPLTAQVEHGQRDLELKLDGYKVWRQTLAVEAGVSQNLPSIALVKADGLIDVRSSPSGAAVTVDGRFRGETPLELELAPGRSYSVSLSKAGYAPVSRKVEPVSGEDTSLVVTLQGMLGVVRVVSETPDAEVYVDGTLRGKAPQNLNLTAVPHRIEVRKAGYAAHTSTVTPRPGFDQQVVARLQEEAVARRASLPQRVETKAGLEFVLVAAPGQFEMGASRREPGRRANETLYEVNLQRAFYVGTTEVTNAEYRKYAKEHNSGTRDAYGLNEDKQPVVRVAWEDAVRYCNWLSAQEGLPAAYTEANGKFFPVSPMTTGYRLPTEAEWTWVARYSAGKAIRFPWGDDMPPPPKAGNFADQSARSTVSIVIEGYDDSYAATAPVGSFVPNALGLYDLGGNVGEWAHDLYSIEVSSGFEVLTDPTGPTSGELHVIRGSTYQQGEAANLRLTYRDYGKDSRDDVGFRIARYAE